MIPFREECNSERPRIKGGNGMNYIKLGHVSFFVVYLKVQVINGCDIRS